MPTASKKSDVSGTRAESFRVPIDCVVNLRLGPSGDWKRTSATNISMSGMFLRTREVHPSGSTLEVKFELHNGQSAIRAEVEVLWRRVRDVGPEAPQGLGVRFINLDLESKYAISRLVDRYQQLGRVPFQLAAAEDEPLAFDRASWHRRGALVLAFLAGIIAGAAGSFWLVAKSGEQHGQMAGVAQASELTRSPAQRGQPEVTPETSSEKLPVPTVDAAIAAADSPADDLAPAAIAAVEAWARAWAAKDVERYLAFYSNEFRPASGRSLDAWRAERRLRLARPGAIEVALSSLKADILGPERAVVRFDQNYAAPGYRDRVRKVLELVRQDQEWRIEREEIQAELPTD